MKPYKLVFCLVEDQTDWETSMTGYTKQQNIMYMSRTWNNTSHWSLSDQILTEEIKLEFTHIPNGSQWEWWPIVNPFVFQVVYVCHTPCMYYNYTRKRWGNRKWTDNYQYKMQQVRHHVYTYVLVHKQMSIYNLQRFVYNLGSLVDVSCDTHLLSFLLTYPLISEYDKFVYIVPLMNEALL